MLFYMNVNDYVVRVSCGLRLFDNKLKITNKQTELYKHNLALMQSLNYKILQTKANFPLGEREDFHERKS